MDDKQFQEQYEIYLRAVEDYLNQLFLSNSPYQKLNESMRYSLLSGGKRLRPVLTLECARLAGIQNWQDALPFACALELVHTYSLIHDDLPCMDNDNLRRGKPTNHVVFGETMATLAGDALQAEAYRLIAEAPGLNSDAKVKAVRSLAWASGANGMVAGQVLDLSQYGCDRETLTDLCDRKTCFMIKCAAELGCAAANASEELCSALVSYASALGLAFQIRDDLLDVIGDEATFGKPIGSDRDEGKTTFVDILGPDGCEAEVHRLTKQAVSSLCGMDGTGFLTVLAERMEKRSS